MNIVRWLKRLGSRQRPPARYSGVICFVPALGTFLARNHCPTCDRRTFFVVSTYEWYSPMATCLHCGDTWHGGEMQERPFRRAWRKEAIEQARVRWRRANRGTA